ncbi:MAG: beta-lactamase family protein [Pseudomonadales bacterium]|nr:beta-lactamase family protein [Pseudomonadales bacterium]
MTTLQTIENNYDFSEMHDSIQTYVDKNILSGASSVVLKNNEIVDVKMWGQMDMENNKPMQSDTIFRIFSNTKKVVSVAAMIMYDRAAFNLDDPLEKYIPEFEKLRVLKSGAEDPTQTEALNSAPTVRQLMCHNAGFSYGIFVESAVDTLYLDQNILDANNTLEQMVKKLGEIPLASQPGSRWQYSVSVDVLGRLVEIWSGLPLDQFLQENIFEPLSMKDSGFYVPKESHHRLAANYVPVNPLDPMEGGLTLQPDHPIGATTTPKKLFSGGAGLASTLGDYTNFIQMLIGKGEWQGNRILKPETVKLMHTNQLPKGVGLVLPNWPMENTGFGLGLAVKSAPGEGEPDAAKGEYHWGGLAGTHSWVSPETGIAGIIFTQRLPGFFHPFSQDFKRLVYDVLAE